MTIVKGLFYSEDHEWVKVEGNTAYVGITDYAQHALGDIVFVELPEIDKELKVGDVFGVVESVKAASDMFTPISGTILEANEEIVDDPALINQDAFANWMIKLELGDKSELDKLMNAKEYEDFCGEEA